MATPTSALAVENWFETTLSSSISASTTTIPLNALPTGSQGYLVIEPDNEDTREIIFYTSKTASEVVCSSAGDGRGQDGTTGVSHASGATVRMHIVKGHFDALQSGDALADDAVQFRSIENSEELMFDHVASGCVWSGDSYGGSLAASMTAGVVYIGGKRVAVSAITARSFTASKDTYVDVGDDGVVDYTEVANNAASPALAASHIRLAIIVSGASIAAVGSVNQGQENKVLPIASSIPYQVTDSLGNLICPRDPNRKLLGLRRRTSSDFTTTNTTATQITELSCPVIVPTGRKVKVTACSRSVYVTTNITANLTIWDGTVGSGTQLAQGSGLYTGTGSARSVGLAEAITTPAASSKTYNAGLHAESAGTATFESAATYPGFIKVELV